MQSYAHKQYDSKDLIGVYRLTNLDRAFAEQNGFMKDRIVFISHGTALQVLHFFRNVMVLMVKFEPLSRNSTNKSCFLM